MKLSDADVKALDILSRSRSTTAMDFAMSMWPDSPGWRVSKSCGNLGSARGVGMARAGNGLLGKLAKRGLVDREWPCFGKVTKWSITENGRRALAEAGL